MNNTNFKNIFILGGIIFFVLIFALSKGFLGSLLVFLALLPIIIFLFFNPKISAFLFMLSIIFTEFYWIELMGGYIKPFHIMSLLLFFFYSIFHLKILMRSRTFWLFIFFTIVSFFGVAFSENQGDSLRSLILPLLLFSIAINTGVVLYTKKINEETLKKIILYGSLITIIFGLLQILGYAFAGVLLTLTEPQQNQIALHNRPPSFFTEADTFGKFLSFPFFFLLPFALDKKNKSDKKLRFYTIIMLLAIFVNMTRSALIGIGISILIYILYLFKKRSLSRNIALIYAIAALSIFTLPLILVTTIAIGSHKQLSYRLESLKNPVNAIEKDQSVAFRKIGLERTFNASIENIKVFLIGHGWGSSIIEFEGEPHSVGGNLFNNILYYSGIFALIIFLLICIRIIHIALKVSKKEEPQKRAPFAEGILFSFIVMLIISQFASMWIAPEFWLVIGCGIYLELISRKESRQSFSPKTFPFTNIIRNPNANPPSA